MLMRFLKDQSGATAIEYGLLAAVIGAAIVGLSASFDDDMKSGFNSLGTNFATKTAVF